MALAAGGRIVGIVVDGFDKAVLRPTIIEAVMVVVLIAAHVWLG